MGEEFQETQDEITRVNTAAAAVSNPLLAGVIFVLRWIQARFFA
jgi:hypothetical protein